MNGHVPLNTRIGYQGSLWDLLPQRTSKKEKKKKRATKHMSAQECLGGAVPSTNWENQRRKNQMNSRIIPMLIPCKEQSQKKR